MTNWFAPPVVFSDGQILTSAQINTTVNTIAAGTVGVANGGTGLTVAVSGGILYASSTSVVAWSAALAANGVVLGGGAGATPSTTSAGAADTVLRVPGAGGAPAFGSIDLTKTAAVTGALLASRGGSGADLSAAAIGAVPYFSATGVQSALAAGTSGFVLTAQGAAPPIFAAVAASTTSTPADVTASRALNTSYQNASATKYLHVLAAILHSGVTTSFQLGSATAPTAVVSFFQNTGAGTHNSTHSVFVPPLWYYRLQGTSLPSNSWWEMTF